MAKKTDRSSDRMLLNPSVHRNIIRDVTDLVESIRDEHFKLEYFLGEWLSKINDPSSDVTSSERRSRAIQKWIDTELRNAKTNQRLLLDRTTFSVVGDSDKLLETAAGYVRDIIGEEVPTDLWHKCRFSGGASTSKSRVVGSPANKFKEKADITASAIPYFDQSRSILWDTLAPPVLQEVKGNTLFTVPKNATIDRVACKEPDLNMYLQLAAGGHIRERLKAVGIDLNDQTKNQRLARKGSLDGSLATVDLSSASDSVTTQLCCRLLPVDWFVLLDNIRCNVTVIDGVEHENEMFSSMGNGFTFELESLIFFALTRAVCYHSGVGGTISVYGDDIIMPSSVITQLTQVFGFCGFLLNPKKSFAVGPFRESCGAHWYNGVDVTPFYIKKPIDHISRLIHFLNRLRAWCSVDGVCDPRFHPIWKKYSKLIPTNLKGGKDTDRIDSLVTLCAPKNLLIKVSRNVKKHDVGNYLVWHSGKLRSPESDIETMEEIPLERFVVRRRTALAKEHESSPWNVSKVPWFPTEIDESIKHP